MRTNRFSRSNLSQLLVCVSFGSLYIYGIFFSDSALYLEVADPYPLNNGETINESHIVALRSLPHLRAINTLVSYKNREERENKNDKEDNPMKYLNHNQTSPEASALANRTDDAKLSVDQGAGTKVRHSNKLTMSSILYPILTLFMISLSCRCLLAMLIHRHSNQIQELGFDSGGQIQRTSRPRPNDQRISFWQSFRTIPTRTRSRTRQNIDRRLLLDLTNRLNEQRVRNGSRPLGAESMEFLLSNNRARENFSGNDYEELWTIQEDNGNALSVEADRHVGVTDEDIARYPVRYLEQGDELLQNHNGETGHNDVQEDKRCAICLEDFRVGDMIRTIPCFHCYHTNCIDQWLREKAICPICKHETIS